MSEKDNKKNRKAAEAAESAAKEAAPEAAESAAEAAEDTYTVTKAQMEQMEALAKTLADANDKYLRLAAEYDNYRKRTAREKEHLYNDAKIDTIKGMLPVYDNLERALAQETQDAAFKKGVEMTLTELVKILDALGVKPFGEAGETFDPQRHNAVMHIEDESLGENVIAEVFQKGFKVGEKVVRFAMVKVAN